MAQTAEYAAPNGARLRIDADGAVRITNAHGGLEVGPDGLKIYTADGTSLALVGGEAPVAVLEKGRPGFSPGAIPCPARHSGGAVCFRGKAHDGPHRGCDEHLRDVTWSEVSVDP